MSTPRPRRSGKYPGLPRPLYLAVISDEEEEEEEEGEPPGDERDPEDLAEESIMAITYRNQDIENIINSVNRAYHQGRSEKRRRGTDGRWELRSRREPTTYHNSKDRGTFQERRDKLLGDKCPRCGKKTQTNDHPLKYCTKIAKCEKCGKDSHMTKYCARTPREFPRGASNQMYQCTAEDSEGPSDHKEEDDADEVNLKKEKYYAEKDVSLNETKLKIEDEEENNLKMLKKWMIYHRKEESLMQKLTQQVIKLSESLRERDVNVKKLETTKKVERYRISYRKVEAQVNASTPAPIPKIVITPPPSNPVDGFKPEDFEAILAMIPKDNVYRTNKPAKHDQPAPVAVAMPRTARQTNNRIAIPPPRHLESFIRPRHHQVKVKWIQTIHEFEVKKGWISEEEMDTARQL